MLNLLVYVLGAVLQAFEQATERDVRMSLENCLKYAPHRMASEPHDDDRHQLTTGYVPRVSNNLAIGNGSVPGHNRPVTAKVIAPLGRDRPFLPNRTR